MSTAVSAKEISEAWLAYVSDRFLLRDGSIRPEVDEEYRRLEESDAIAQERELWRSYTDTLIDAILQASSESRGQLLSRSDPKSLVFVQERITRGTELLIGIVQQGLRIETNGTSLEEFFRQILLQSPAV